MDKTVEELLMLIPENYRWEMFSDKDVGKVFRLRPAKEKSLKNLVIGIDGTVKGAIMEGLSRLPKN